MKRLFWILVIFGAYIWTMTSGNDQLVLTLGKKIYHSIVSWFEDAEIDFQVEKQKTHRRHRRWD